MCVLGLIVCPMTHTRTLREARRARRITQVQLAERARVDQTYVSLIERGLRSPSDYIKSRLAKALRITPSSLRFELPSPDASLAQGSDREGHSAVVRG